MPEPTNPRFFSTLHLDSEQEKYAVLEASGTDIFLPVMLDHGCVFFMQPVAELQPGRFDFMGFQSKEKAWEKVRECVAAEAPASKE